MGQRPNANQRGSGGTVSNGARAPRISAAQEETANRPRPGSDVTAANQEPIDASLSDPDPTDSDAVPPSLDLEIDKVVELLQRGEPPGESEPSRKSLLGHCAEIAHILEVYWPDIGGELQRFRTPAFNRTPEVVRKVFERIPIRVSQNLLWSVSQLSSMAASPIEVRKTYQAYSEALKRVRNIQAARDVQASKCEEANSAVFEASPAHRKELQKEITRRIFNRIQLRQEYQVKKEALKTAQIKLPKTEPSLLPAAQVEVFALQTEYDKSKEILEIEDEILRGVKKRHDFATQQNWITAKKVADKRSASLKELDAALQQARAEAQRLESLYQDQAAGFAQQDFLDFITERRSRLQPRQLARALAGLPLLTCRDSFDQCRDCSFPDDPEMNYELVQVIERAWGKRDVTATDPKLHEQLFWNEIEDLPKTRRWNRTRVSNWVRDKFEAHRQELKEAIQVCWTLSPLPGQVPYIITAKFLEDIAREQQKTPLERVLSEGPEGK